MWTPTTRAQHSRAGLRYGSDVTDAAWLMLLPFLPPPRGCGCPRKWEMREVFNAIFYVLRARRSPALRRKEERSRRRDRRPYLLPIGRQISERAIVSVKGGENVGVTMIRDPKGVLEREKASIGAFLTLVPHSQPMIREAASAGFYTQGTRQYPRIQIITVADR